MIHRSLTSVVRIVTMLSSVCFCLAQQPPSAAKPTPTEGDYIAHDFHFKSGETLPELRLHYTTFGKPERDATGKVTNAVLILHGTSGSGRQFLAPQFADVLYGPGQLLDATRYFIILPDNIGHGKSSKPSDGMRAHFPQYDYDDMVAAQHEWLERGLGVNHLRYALPWHVLEPERGRFDWSMADERIEEAQKLGLNLMLDVMHFGTPRRVATSLCPGSWSAREQTQASASRYLS